MNNKKLKRAATDYTIRTFVSEEKETDPKISKAGAEGFKAGVAYAEAEAEKTMQKLRNRPQVEHWNLSADRIYLHVLLTTTIMQRGLDELENTSFYKRALKSSAKTFSRELQRVIAEDVPLISDVDNEGMYLIMSYQDEVAARIAELDVDSYGAILEFLDQYRADPARMLQVLGIEKTDNSALAQGEYNNRTA